MELTKEKLVMVATELNQVCKFDKPIETAFEPTAKGAAAKSQEAKFLRELALEIVNVLEDKELVMSSDMPKFTDEAKETIKVLVPEQIERLFPGESVEAVEMEETLNGKGKPVSLAAVKAAHGFKFAFAFRFNIMQNYG